MHKLLSKFLFVHLAEADPAKPVEFLRTGTFTDMNGREVKITEADLDAFVQNFSAGAAGQEVPIDIDHERREAGGWITKVERAGDKLMAWINWNALGTQLVSDKIYRYLSATLDLTGKILKSISLVNFPAVKGLKPVELSEGALAYQQMGIFEAIQDMVAGVLGKNSQAQLADGIPGSVTISQFLQASVHRVFTNAADGLAISGYLSTEERIQLSSAIGAALETFATNTGEAGGRLIPAPDYYPTYFKQPAPKEATNPMNEQEKEALRKQIVAEERARIETELAERQKTEAQLREQIRKEETELAEARFKARQGLIEFATKLTQGEAGLSAKADDVVAFLEALTPEQQEVAKTMLQAKVAKLGEIGSAGNGQEQKLTIPQHARNDIIAGELTVKELFAAQVLPGKVEDYDLAEFDAKQKGF